MKGLDEDMWVPVILSGGAGSRLWPLSRQHFPKQCIALADRDLSLMQQTVQRLLPASTSHNPIIVCNQDHRFLMAEQMREVGVTPRSILLEPIGRNTAPATALAAFEAMSTQKDPVLLVLPSDHLIKGSQEFHKAIEAGFHCADQGKLVTLGVPAQSPHVGYGYIRRGEAYGDVCVEAFNVAEFVEKPSLDRAQDYVASGDYFWNSGIFIFRASKYLSELALYNAEIYHYCKEAYDAAQSDLDFTRIDRDSFEQCPSQSIDYAVMEKTDDAVVIPLQSEWSDLGEWSSLWEAGSKDSAGNVRIGDVVTDSVNNSYIRAESRLVAALGVDNQIIVETPDAVLVMDKSRAQDVKRIVKSLQADRRIEADHHARVYRPWGSYQLLASGDRFQVKRILVNPGSALSLQLHHHRAEHWVVVRGEGKVTCGSKTFLLNEDQSTYIPIGTRHRLENPGQTPLELIEVQSGGYLGEDDIVRFEDVYGRSGEV